MLRKVYNLCGLTGRLFSSTVWVGGVMYIGHRPTAQHKAPLSTDRRSRQIFSVWISSALIFWPPNSASPASIQPGVTRTLQASSAVTFHVGDLYFLTEGSEVDKRACRTSSHPLVRTSVEWRITYHGLPTFVSVYGYDANAPSGYQGYLKSKQQFSKLSDYRPYPSIYTSTDTSVITCARQMLKNMYGRPAGHFCSTLEKISGRAAMVFSFYADSPPTLEDWTATRQNLLRIIASHKIPPTNSHCGVSP